MAVIGYSYDDAALREDLLDLLTNISPTDTQLVTGLGVSEAKSIRHEWLKDTLASVGTNAQIEGASVAFSSGTNPTRLINYTQIISKPFSVTETERATNTAAFDDRYSYEQTKKLKEWKNDLELALMRGSLACGTGSAARQMKGIKNWLTLATSQSGVSLTESILNDYLQNVWSNGTTVNAIYAGMYIKRKISGFTSGSTKNVDANDRRLVNAVDIYEADAAPMVKLFAHRHVTISGDTNHDVVGINEDFFKVAYLRKPKSEETAKVSDSTDGFIIGEATLECLHDNAGFWSQRHL